MFQPNPATPAPRAVDEPRFADLFVDDGEDARLVGVPFDASVLGRKGCAEGPTGIREAFRFLATSGAGRPDLVSKVRDMGDVAGLSHDVLASHAVVRKALRDALAPGLPTVILGGDHGLTFPHVQALCDNVDGRIGIVVLDAHYDLRGYEGQPTSGTPFRRILHELDGRVAASNIAEIGIRPYANTRGLAAYAQAQGVGVWTMDDVRRDGIAAVTENALEAAGDGVDHLWMSVDIDGLDQSIAAGCSAPGPGGLTFDEADHVVGAVAQDPRTRVMDVLEVAPCYDPTGNTVRSAAGLVATFLARV